MTLKIKLQKDIEVPEGTKVITNNNFLTVAFAERNSIKVYTELIQDLDISELSDEDNYTEFTRLELQKMLKML